MKIINQNLTFLWNHWINFIEISFSGMSLRYSSMNFRESIWVWCLLDCLTECLSLISMWMPKISWKDDLDQVTEYGIWLGSVHCAWNNIHTHKKKWDEAVCKLRIDLPGLWGRRVHQALIVKVHIKNCIHFTKIVVFVIFSYMYLQSGSKSLMFCGFIDLLYYARAVTQFHSFIP